MTPGDKLNKLHDLVQQRNNLNNQIATLRLEVDADLRAMNNPEGRGRPNKKNGKGDQLSMIQE